MSDNKNLPKCDCINDCGDDDKVAKGLRQRCNRYDEIQAENLDNEALRLLSNAMRSKLAASRRKGRSGWNDKTQCSAEHLSQLLREHVEKGDPVDVANFCMMLHQRGERILEQAATSPSTSQTPGNNERDSYFFLAGWNGANSACDATLRFREVSLSAPALKGGAA